ncbi:hypothetical protein ACJO2A_10030 [Vibrio parahaemolyticus]|nr:hypothetical protein [Vibrio parahaemolyticus]EGQ7688473.1 hypothetical protein [Vibrio parahaemolyticus]EGQ8186710.1 hypothetical protein [Vibrio parahaemolyticus]EGQ8546646.1 hypothetical protein [Vibrio parahaemolyticus]EGR1757930.1 hypothetical protein [Vibrio parahaemolyticus]EJG0664754.1 hypothetical protein [Vibrio parahaemolyticus]
MDSGQDVSQWKWYHAFYILGVTTTITAFSLETPPLIGHQFWLPFWLSFVWVGGFGDVSSKRRKMKGGAGWETYLKLNALSMFFIFLFIVSAVLCIYALRQ